MMTRTIFLQLPETDKADVFKVAAKLDIPLMGIEETRPAVYITSNEVIPAVAFTIMGMSMQISRTVDWVASLKLGNIDYFCSLGNGEPATAFFIICSGNILNIAEAWKKSSAKYELHGNYIEAGISSFSSTECRIEGIIPPLAADETAIKLYTESWKEMLKSISSELNGRVLFEETHYCAYPQ